MNVPSYELVRERPNLSTAGRQPWLGEHRGGSGCADLAPESFCEVLHLSWAHIVNAIILSLSLYKRRKRRFGEVDTMSHRPLQVQGIPR